MHMGRSVTVAIPALNEERYIARCLTTLLPQAQEFNADIVVVDGGSDDATRHIVMTFAKDHPNVRLLENPDRIQSAGINRAARSVDSDIIVRADAHAEYPLDFLKCCIDALEKHNATSVVVPMRTYGQRGFQKAVAATQNSRLGNGGSPHRTAGESRFVDHGHHAAFVRTFFLAIGGYDESFTHNEDAELDHRAHKAGGRIWLCAEAPVTYFPRRDPWHLAKQYFRHGKGRARMLRKWRKYPKPRQLAPVAILATVMSGMALSPISLICALGPAAYFALCTGWGLASAIRERDTSLLMMGFAAMIMHLSWASGCIVGWSQPSNTPVQPSRERVGFDG
jgi:succinoglycan biosynthesis protein ExoA